MSHTFSASTVFSPIHFEFKQINNWTILFPFYFSNIILRTNLLAVEAGEARATWMRDWSIPSSKVIGQVLDLFWVLFGHPFANMVRPQIHT